MTLSDMTVEALIQSNKELSESVRALSLAVHAVLEMSASDGPEQEEVERYLNGDPVGE